MEYGPRVLDALLLMYRLHAGQVRKGAGVPYITHLLAVASLVGEHGGDEDQFIAALLHDAVEDAGGQATLAEIRGQFGERVARLVWACTDTDTEPKPPWRARKEAFLAGIPGMAPEARLIVAADKVHNARATALDVLRDGALVWERFRGGRDGTLWYYSAAMEALSLGWKHSILEELAQAVQRLTSAAEKA